MHKAAISTLLASMLLAAWGVEALMQGAIMAAIAVLAVAVTLLVASGALWLAYREGGLARVSWVTEDSDELRTGYRR